MAVTITAQARNNRGAALLSLAVTSGTGTVVVTRQFGNTSELIRENPVAVTTTPVEVLDYEVPLNVPCTYLATVDSTGDSEVSNEVTVSGNGQDFIVSLSDPSRSTSVQVVEFPEFTYGTRVSILPIIGRGNPVSQSDKVIYASGQLILHADSQGQVDVLESILADGWPFLFKTPPARAGRRYMVATGAKVQRIIPLGEEQARRIIIDYQTVDASASIYTPVAGQYSWDQLVIDHATWNDVPVAFQTWNDVAVGPDGASGRGPLGGF